MYVIAPGADLLNCPMNKNFNNQLSIYFSPDTGQLPALRRDEPEYEER